MHAEQSQTIDAEVVEPTPTPRAQALSVVGNSTPARMIDYAMQQNAPIERLEQLLELQVRWEANEARKAFHLALADFKAEPLSIAKDKLVSIKHKDGNGVTEYRHATLGNVVATIAPALGRHRLSHSWAVKREGDRVFVTCRLTHALGHSEEVTLDGPLDTSGSKNNIQSVGSTITYLERYTLLAITGIATTDQDDDGKTGGASVEYISEQQEATLREILTEAKANLPAFLEFAQVDALSHIPAKNYETVLKVANQKLSASRKAGK